MVAQISHVAIVVVPRWTDRSKCQRRDFEVKFTLDANLKGFITEIPGEFYVLQTVHLIDPLFMIMLHNKFANFW